MKKVSIFAERGGSLRGTAELVVRCIENGMNHARSLYDAANCRYEKYIIVFTAKPKHETHAASHSEQFPFKASPWPTCTAVVVSLCGASWVVPVPPP